MAVVVVADLAGDVVVAVVIVVVVLSLRIETLGGILMAVKFRYILSLPAATRDNKECL